MASADKTSLSSIKPLPSKVTRISRCQDQGRDQLSNLSALKSAGIKICSVKRVSINVTANADPSVSAPAFLHVPQDYQCEKTEDRERTGAILLSGAGGGVAGPSSMYLSIADKLASLRGGISVLRLDYRYPARNKYCVMDVQAAMNYMEKDYAISRFVLVGWSFGGAPVFTVGGMDKRVIGCATVASQTAETEGIRNLNPRPVLLLHGTGDRTLSPSCSRRLYQMYGSRGVRTIKLFDDDDHALTRNSLEAEEMLCQFITKCAGVEIDHDEHVKVVQKELVRGEEKVETMKRSGDLGGGESVE